MANLTPKQYQSLALVQARQTVLKMGKHGLLGGSTAMRYHDYMNTPKPRTEQGFKVEPYQFLSNFAPCTVTMYGVEYPSVEHAYQASKCAYPSDRQLFLNITAGQAKRLGRQVAVRPDFDQVKLTFMETLLRRKFSDANPELKRQLIATGDIELVEVNHWNDTFWGECNGIGENHLGKLLMFIRAELQQSTASLVAKYFTLL